MHFFCRFFLKCVGSPYVVGAVTTTPHQTNTTMTKKTATENAVTPAIEYSEIWNKDNELYRFFQIWMTEGWSKKFLQQFKNGGWVTLY